MIVCPSTTLRGGFFLHRHLMCQMNDLVIDQISQEGSQRNRIAVGKAKTQAYLLLV